MSKQIFLNQNAKATVDDDDYEWLSVRPWALSASGHVIAFVINSGRLELVQMARVVMNALPDETVVYIDPTNELDNRRCNLRLVPPKRGFLRRWFSPMTVPGLRGVSWHRLRRQYHVGVRFRKRHYDLGYYQDPRMAGMVFDAAERQLSCFYAYRNFPARPTPPDLAENVAALLAKQQNGR